MPAARRSSGLCLIWRYRLGWLFAACARRIAGASARNWANLLARDSASSHRPAAICSRKTLIFVRRIPNSMARIG